MQVGNKVTVYELIKREDGSVSGIGNSLEVSEAEGVALVKAGTHKCEDKPLGYSEKIEAKPKTKELKQGDE